MRSVQPPSAASLALTLALALSACRGHRNAPASAPDASPHAARTVDAAAPDDTTPCGPLLADGRRALEVWRRRATGLRDESVWRAIAALNHCETHDDDTWATVLAPPTGDSTGEAVTGRFKLVHLDANGTRSEAMPALSEEGEGFALRGEEHNWSADARGVTAFGAWQFVDYDGDARPEVLVPVRLGEGDDAQRWLLVWKALPARIEAFEPAMGLHPLDADDLDHDGRPDLLTHGELVAETLAPGGEARTLHGPALAAVSRPGGVFLTSSGAALQHNRAACPAPPTRYLEDPSNLALAAKNVACAMLWRVPPAQVVTALRRECPAARADVPSSCAATLPALEALTRVTPQADVRDAVSFRFEEIPVPNATDETRRGRYTLHVEGTPRPFPATVALGEITGTCTVEAAVPAQQIVARLRCWRGTSGDEFQVFRRGPALAVQQRTVTPETPAAPWREVGRALVDATAPLRPGDVDAF